MIRSASAHASTLSDGLAGLSYRIEVASTWHAVQTAIDRDQFDAIIIDRLLDDTDGLVMVRKLRRERVPTPIVMLDPSERSGAIVDGLDAGADDCVTTSVPALELSARLKALVRGRQLAATTIDDTLRIGDIVVSPRRFRVWRSDHSVALARLEMKLLIELARHAETVMTRATLIERIWGQAVVVNASTVDGYIRHLRRKLTSFGGDNPIVTVHGVGYMLTALAPTG